MAKSTNPTDSKKGAEQASYSAKDIYVLEGLEPVRKRPGMYIGSTGTDGLHHLVWEVVDNSLTHQSPVLVERDGKIRLEKIGEIVDSAIEANSQNVSKSKDVEILRSGFDMKALSFNPSTLKLSWQRIGSLIRHKVNSEILEITLQNGRKIEITPYHSLFTFKEGQVASIKGSELGEGSYVIVPKKFSEPEKRITSLNLLDEFEKIAEEKTKSLNLYGVHGLLNEDVKPFVKEYADLTGTKQHSANILNDYRRYDYLPFNLWRRFSPELRKKFADCPIGNKRNTELKLKSQLSISHELIELLGIYAAEGTAFIGKTNRVVFSFGAHEKELIAHTAGLIEKVFDYTAVPHYAHETATTLQIDSLTIVLLFREVLACGGNSHTKQVSSLIFNLPPDLRERFLVAYLAGDGYPSKKFTECLLENSAPTATERSKFAAVSASRELINGLSYLLFTLGKTFSMGELRQEGGGKVSVRYHDKISTTVMPATHSWKIDFYWNTNASYIDRLPAKDVFAKTFWQRPYSFSFNARGGVTTAKVSTLAETGRIVLRAGALKFLHSDLGLLKVTKIRKVPYGHPWVYDFSVPDGENFVGGFSPICVHNSIDEAMAGHAKNITVELLPENKVSVTDDGRGIPVETHKQTKKSALETVMTTLHAGGKFGGESYKVAGGLHGVGVSVVNALSEWLRVEVSRDGELYAQEYKRGKPEYKVKKIGISKKTGTKVIFSPDPEVFSEISFNDKIILEHLRRQAYLTKGVRINFLDKRGKVPHYYGFYFEGGLLSFVKFLSKGKKPIQEEFFYAHKEQDKIEVETAFLYVDDTKIEEWSFANNIYTPDGGMHLTGFRSALTRSLNSYARAEGYLKEKDENLISEDTREGLVAVISIKLREPQFEGQTKARLGNPGARTAAETVVGDALKEFLEKRPAEARRIIEKVLLTAKARMAAKAAKETVLRKGAFEGLTLPGKLADCISKHPEESELFVVEGDSAGGSCKSARDRRTQAILPLKGKILNVEKARLDKMLANTEIRSLVVAIGTAIAEEFDLAKLRYHKIILMSDADVDGAHIRTLLLTFFYRYFRKVIDSGFLYIAQPPLYRIQSGKEIRYAFSDPEKENIIVDLRRIERRPTQKIPRESASSQRESAPVNIQRYKGLGEMSAEQLWETTMNPAVRILKQVTIDDASEANRLFEILMGDEVEPRRRFIEAHATAVQNLDV